MATLIAYLSVVSPLPGIFFGVHGKNKLSKSASLILLFMLISFVSDITLLITGRLKMNNFPVIHLYGIISGTLMLFFFKELFKNRTRIITVLLVAFVIFYVTDSLWITGLTKSNAISQTLQNFLAIGLCVAYFYRIYVNETDIFIERSPDFIIVLGFLFYSTGAFFSWLLSTDILTTAIPGDQFYGSWILHNIANITKNSIFAIALWRARRI